MTHNLLNRLAAYAAHFTKMRGASSLAVTTGAALTLSTSLIAAEIPLLNHNFDSDAIPLNPGYTTSISGWVNTGYGTSGVYAPESQKQYSDAGSRGQVAFLWNGGRLSQTINTTLTLGEQYQLTFDIGQPKNHTEQHFVVRFKAKGLVLAQAHIDEFNVTDNHWNTGNLYFTANETMPIGEPLVVEFQNLSSSTLSQTDIDNITLSTAGTGTASPGTQLGPLTMIIEDSTLLVPNQYPNINAALRYLDDKQIKVGTTVTIQVTDCTNQVYNESINVAHPNGNFIHIVGNVDSPESCVLQFNGVSGFVLSENSHLKSLKGFSLNGDKHSEAIGIDINRNSSIHQVSYMHITGFKMGFKVENSSSSNLSNSTIENARVAGVSSIMGSSMTADNVVSKNNARGFYASNGANLYLINSSANYNSYIGIYARAGAYISTLNTTSTSNGTYNYYPKFNSLGSYGAYIGK